MHLFLKKRYVDTVYLSVALLVYAFFSSSTPDQLGVPEIIIACFLILFVGAKFAALSFYRVFTASNVLPQYLYIMFWMLLLFPLATAVFIRGNSLSNILRDIIPFVYLFIPIFFIEKMKAHPKYWRRVLAVLISVIGISYALRHLATDANPLAAIGQTIIGGDKNYFVMDPSVLFSANFLLLLGIRLALIDKKKVLASITFFAGSVAFVGIISILVRAQIILVIFSLIAYAIYISKRSIVYLVYLVILAAVIMYFSWDILGNLFNMVMGKFETAGLNNRDAELTMIIDYGNASLPNFLVGEGWGGVIQNPTSPGEKVRFAHNIFIFYMLKTGIFGLLMFSVYYFHLVFSLLKIKLSPETFIVYSTAINFCIVYTLLEAGYKSLSAGLVLLFFFLHTNRVNHA